MVMAGERVGCDTDWQQFALGTRVVVRRQVGAQSGIGGSMSNAASPRPGVKFSDVIGIVTKITADALTVRRDAAGYPNDAEVQIAGSEIVAIKQVPPRPSRRSQTFSSMNN